MGESKESLRGIQKISEMTPIQADFYFQNNFLKHGKSI